MAHIGEKELHELAMSKERSLGKGAAMSVLATAYYDLAMETLSTPGALDCPRRKYEALAGYWRRGLKNLDASYSASDTVKYDIGVASPRMMTAPVSHCHLTEEHLKKAKGSSDLWRDYMQEKGRSLAKKNSSLVDLETAQRLLPIRERITKFSGRIAHEAFTVAVKADGTVVAIGSSTFGDTIGNRINSELNSWHDIVAVSTQNAYSFGLKKDGTVVASGYHERCNIGSWRDIVAISAGEGHTVGLKVDGSVVAVGINDKGCCNTESWHNIIAISAGGGLTVGLKADGTVVVAGELANSADYLNLYAVEYWHDIVAISAAGGLTVGLKADGTIVLGINEEEKNLAIRAAEHWRDIVAISVAGDWHYDIVGLKADGTVVSTKDSYRDSIKGWQDIVAISAGKYSTVGLKADGRIVKVETAVEDEYKDEYNATPEQLEEKQKNEWEIKGRCCYCGGKWGFGRKCKTCRAKN